MSQPAIQIGKFNKLEVLKRTDFGIYVGDEVEEILMPNKFVPEGTEVGDMIDAFIYTDSEDRMIATTVTPMVQLHQFAFLKVNQMTSFGAFLSWGVEKDLLVPFKEQQTRMEDGKSYVVYMYLDEVTDRLVGSSHLNKFLEKEDIPLEEGQEVTILVSQETDLGFKAIINQKYLGLIYKNEIFTDLQVGDTTVAYVKQVRPDKKIDLSLQKQGFQVVEPTSQVILDKLKAANGFLPLHDGSKPELIYSSLKMSKKVFKKAIGTLYKKRLITIEPTGIRLK